MDYLERYAELIVKTGINIQKNQILVINCPVDCADFAHLIQKAAYKAGSGEVVMRWRDEKTDKIKYDLAPDSLFDEFPEWMSVMYNGYTKKGAGFISIASSDPDIMKGVDPSKISRFNKASNKALEFWRTKTMNNENTWCVACVPTKAWAKKVFPGKSEEEAIDLLWQAIFRSVRVDTQDPVKSWEEHQKNLSKRAKWLNENNFASLHYQNSLGTDFTVGLPEGHIWMGGADSCQDKYYFFPNMPTEEIFTLPDNTKAEGKLFAALPLNYNGALIEEFWFEFKDGQVVDYGAKNGKEAIKTILDTDAGAKRLGEVALVQYDSPISREGILFYNTLFDENAACHFALGKAYPSTLKGGSDMSDAELKQHNVNDSLTHIDFMVGTKDLTITGIKKDGSQVKVFENGNFVAY